MKKSKVVIILIIGMIVGLSISGIGTYAATTYAINSSNVEYQDNSSLGVTNVQAAIDGTCTKFSNQLTNLKKEVINEMYPKGSIYITTELTTSSQVAEKLGGTWEVYGTGKTLVGVDSSNSSYSTANKTGGSSIATLSVSNIPSHSHTYKPSGSVTSTFSDKGLAMTVKSSTHYSGYGNLANGMGFDTVKNGWWGNVNKNVEAINSKFSGTSSSTSACTNCNGNSFSVQNPYITVYMYKRTA